MDDSLTGGMRSSNICTDFVALSGHRNSFNVNVVLNILLARSTDDHISQVIRAHYVRVFLFRTEPRRTPYGLCHDRCARLSNTQTTSRPHDDLSVFTWQRWHLASPYKVFLYISEAVTAGHRFLNIRLRRGVPAPAALLAFLTSDRLLVTVIHPESLLSSSASPGVFADSSSIS